VARRRRDQERAASIVVGHSLLVQPRRLDVAG
jgi:hypothetical protein